MIENLGTEDMKFTPACLLLGCMAWAGEPVDQPLSVKCRVRVKWEGLSMTVGKTAQVATPKGPMVTGKVTAVEPDALVLQVTRTNDPSARLKGELKVPRATLHVVRMQTKRVRYRVIGTSVGAYSGTAVGGILATALKSHGDHTAAAIATFIGVGTAGTVLGYLAGNEADQRWTTIEILP
jgi:hypothetical protein